MSGRSASPIEAARAFGVMLGGSTALGVATALSIAKTTRAVIRRTRPPVWALGGTVALAAYGIALRPWILHWGASDEELARTLPGDELDPSLDRSLTRAVSIDAPVDDVWPWLAQIGQDRGGFYSYEWLENLAGCHMRNAERIHPEWQHRDVGELVYLHPALGLRVARFDTPRVIALEGWGTFVLEPIDGHRTRLLARGRRPRRLAERLYSVVLMELPHFLMERKMLLGIKSRAERSRGVEPARPVPRARRQNVTTT